MPKYFEKGFDYLITGTAVFAMGLMTATVSFLWDLSKSIQILNSQVAVVIEQVSSNERHFQLQLATHDRLFAAQSEKMDSMTDQLRILNDRTAYITNYINVKQR